MIPCGESILKQEAKLYAFVAEMACFFYTSGVTFLPQAQGCRFVFSQLKSIHSAFIFKDQGA
jgi:hypothetical protein